MDIREIVKKVGRPVYEATGLKIALIGANFSVPNGAYQTYELLSYQDDIGTAGSPVQVYNEELDRLEITTESAMILRIRFNTYREGAYETIHQISKYLRSNEYSDSLAKEGIGFIRSFETTTFTPMVNDRYEERGIVTIEVRYLDTNVEVVNYITSARVGYKFLDGKYYPEDVFLEGIVGEPASDMYRRGRVGSCLELNTNVILKGVFEITLNILIDKEVSSVFNTCLLCGIDGNPSSLAIGEDGALMLIKETTSTIKSVYTDSLGLLVQGDNEIILSSSSSNRLTLYINGVDCGTKINPFYQKGGPTFPLGSLGHGVMNVGTFTGFMKSIYITSPSTLNAYYEFNGGYDRVFNNLLTNGTKGRTFSIINGYPSDWVDINKLNSN